MSEDKSALSYWFPKIEAAGLPVPRTKLFNMPKEASADVWALFDGKESNTGMSAFAAQIKEAAVEMGLPVFLRTDHTSGKHNWERTCYVTDADKIAAHIASIAEFSECCGMFGELPWDKWVVREFLPIIPYGVCPGYGNMPINREFRFFVEDGEVKCFHPYWPAESLEQGGAPNTLGYNNLCSLASKDERELRDLASRAGKAVGGAWSIDMLDTERGWFITDMAEAHKSFHWPLCPHKKMPNPGASPV